MRAALYARVSTNGHGQDPEVQLRELREYCQRRSWDVASEYIDVGISGTKEKRPELDRLLIDAHRRRFDAVIVWKFDRFARSVSHLLRALETFKIQGIEFVSLSEQVDTSTPMGKCVFTVLGAVAELERSLIVERVKAGLRNARAKGKKLGRPRTSPGCFEDNGAACTGRRLAGNCETDGSWGRNSLSLLCRVFQNSGKGFWNAHSVQPKPRLGSPTSHPEQRLSRTHSPRMGVLV